MKLLQAIFLILSLAAMPVAAQTAAPQAAKPAAAAGDSPALWRIAGPKGQVHLFGSFHLLPPNVSWRTPAVMRALDRAGTVIFETDLVQSKKSEVMQPLLLEHGTLRDETLEKILPEKVYADFQQVAESLKLPVAQLAPMRPWLASVLLGVQFIISQGYDPTKGVDQQVLAYAQQRKKKLGHLESAESQVRIFGDLPRAQEIELLEVTLRQIRELPRLLDDLLAAYRKGDIAALERTLNLGLDELPALRNRILGDRHEKWLPQIEKLIAQGGNHFIVVGAAHLAGPDSLVTMLRAKGVTVEGP
jgi:uncharacterized protein YbaP (TraB family)